jgi:hypothetical protein
VLDTAILSGVPNTATHVEPSQSVTNGCWSCGRTTWIASFRSAATLTTTSSSSSGLGDTRSQASFQGPVPRRPPLPRPTRLRTWTSTRSRRRSSPPPPLSRIQTRRPSRAARFGDGGLGQRRNGHRQYATLSKVARALGRLDTLPRYMVASAWRCRLVSLFEIFWYSVCLVLTGTSPVFVGSGVSILFQEWRLTKDYTRFALLATVPFLFCVSLVSPPFHSVSAYDLIPGLTVFFTASDYEHLLCVRQSSWDIRQLTHEAWQPRSCCSISRKLEILLGCQTCS